MQNVENFTSYFFVVLIDLYQEDLQYSFKELLNNHLKQTKTAKWARNLLSDCAKLKAKSNEVKKFIDFLKAIGK